MAYCAALLIDLDDESISKLSETSLLNKIYEYRSPYHRYHLISEAVQLSLESLNKIEQKEKNWQGWGVLPSALLMRLEEIGFESGKIENLISKVTNGQLLKNGKHQRIFVQMLFSLLASSPLQEKEVKAFSQFLETTLNSEITRTEKFSQFQMIPTILKTFGKSELVEVLDSDKQLKTYFTEKFESLFELNSENAENLAERYEKTFGQFRNQTALFTYYGSISQLTGDDRERVENALNVYVNAVLEGTFKEKRYDEESSDHLKLLFKNNPKLKEAWIKAEKPKDLQFSTKDEKAPEYKQFLKERIVNDNHLKGVDLTVLIDYLNGGPVPEISAEKNDLANTFTKWALELCEKEIEAEDFARRVVELAQTEEFDLGEFSNDLKVLTSGTMVGNSACRVFESDDPCDLLLIGTDIKGSCQRVNGDPTLNKCLVSYLMNGELRPIVVKEDERIVARSLMRLMWDEEKEAPVILLERIYSNVNNEAISQAIIDMAVAKAESMNVYLVSKECGSGDSYPRTIKCDNGFAPFTYSDAGKNVIDGQFNIKGCHILYTP